MGFKVFSICAFKPPLGPITVESAHDSEQAKLIAMRLGLDNVELIEHSNYDEGLYPDTNEFFIGAYPSGYIISSTKLVDDCFRSFSSLKDICELFLGYELLVLGLHSVVNYWGYIYCRNGDVVRCREGDADHGFIQEYGELLPEEKKLLKGSDIENDLELAEEYVFEISARVFGMRLDQLDFWDIAMEKFHTTSLPEDFRREIGIMPGRPEKQEDKRKQTSLWKRLLNLK